jgi:hypothetical protein
MSELTNKISKKLLKIAIVMLIRLRNQVEKLLVVK